MMQHFIETTKSLPNTDFTEYLIKWTGYDKSWTAEGLKWALQNGKAHVDKIDTNTGMRPIYWACYYGNFYCLDVLLHHGGDVHVNERSLCGKMMPMYPLFDGPWSKGGLLPIDYATGFSEEPFGPVSCACATRLVDAGADLALSTKPLPHWIMTYWRQRKELRLFASIVLMAKRRGSLQDWDRHLVRFLAMRIWELCDQIKPRIPDPRI